VPRTNKNFDSRKEQLIRLALEQFIDKGYENTTITDLQKSFGLTKGGMYHYFDSKEEILDDVIDYGLTQCVNELITELKSIPPEKKLVYFFFSSTANDFAQSLFRYSKKNSPSIVSYRLREKTVALTAPVLKDIILQYIETGFYKTKYPDEMAEFSLILAQAISEEDMLPKASLIHRKRRVDAIIDVWRKCMNPPAGHIHELQENLYKLIGFTIEGN